MPMKSFDGVQESVVHYDAAPNMLSTCGLEGNPNSKEFAMVLSNKIGVINRGMGFKSQPGVPFP